MSLIPPIYLSFIRSLNQGYVKYLVVGGYAVSYYGYQRDTCDLDIWTAPDVDNASKIIQMVQSYGLFDPAISIDLFQHPNRILQIGFPAITGKILDPIIGQKPAIISEFQADQSYRVEILTVQTGVQFTECYAARVVVSIDGVDVNIVSLNHLLQIKRAGNRPKDVIDIKNLE